MRLQGPKLLIPQLQVDGGAECSVMKTGRHWRLEGSGLVAKRGAQVLCGWCGTRGGVLTSEGCSADLDLMSDSFGPVRALVVEQTGWGPAQ
jgi:hypothetical protein